MKKTSQLHNKWTGKTIPELKTIKLKMDVNNRGERPKSLIDDLRPLWKFTRYTAILPDWCQQTENNGNTLRKVLLRFGVFLGWIITTVSIIYDWFILYNDMKTNTSERELNRVINTLFNSWLLILTFVIQSHIIYHHSSYLSFFRDWNILEQHLHRTINFSSLNTPKKMVYITSSVLPILKLFGVVYILFTLKTTCTDLKCYYYPMTETLTPTFSIIFLIVSKVLTVFFIFFHDVLPALVYSHISCAINRLQVKMEQNFSAITCVNSLSIDRSTTFVNQVRRCWRLFDTVSNLTDIANHLFGCIFLVDQAFSVIFVCFLTHGFLCVVIYNFDFFKAFITLFLNIIFIIRLIFFNLKLVNVQSTTIKLRQKITSLSIQHWSLMTGEERSVTDALLNRILQDPIGAAPMDLYTVELSIFLPLLGLIISNVVVLLQNHPIEMQ